MLAADLAQALDPALLARTATITPDPWQEQLLRATDQRILMLCARQTGKSTVAALLALHAALYDSPALILLLAPALRQAQELYRSVRRLLTALDANSDAIKEESALRLELRNGSRIVTLPGTEATIRGFSSVSLVVVDEAARVQDALYHTVRPMLAVSNGRLVLLSTPFGKRGFFYHEWVGRSESGAWRRVSVPATDCPRIAPGFLETERAALGDWWYRQEYLCEFVDPLDSVFHNSHIVGALDPGVAPLFTEAS